MRLFMLIALLIQSVVLHEPAHAGSDAALAKSWEDSHLVSRAELTRMFKEAIRRTEAFAVLAENKLVAADVKKRKLTKSSGEAKSALFASKTFLAFQDTSQALDRRIKTLDGLASELPPLIQESAFLKVSGVARKAKAELKAIAALLALKV